MKFCLCWSFVHVDGISADEFCSCRPLRGRPCVHVGPLAVGLFIDGRMCYRPFVNVGYLSVGLLSVGLLFISAFCPDTHKII